MRNILNDIMKGESETIEFKKSLSEIKEIIKTISAFANTKGGKVIIGVNDNGEIVGVKLGKDTIERLINAIVQNTNPRVYPEIFTEKINDKNVIVISVSERKDKPIFAFGRAYIRSGKNTLQADREIIVQLLRESYGESFEELKMGDIEDINLKIVNEIIDKSAEIGRGKRINALDFLKMLQYITDKPKVCAILLFSDMPQRYLPWAVVKVGKFVGSKLIYEKEIDGNLLNQVEVAYSNVVSLIRKRIKINQLKREEIFEYPLAAIREAITNAIVHRDYSIRSPIYIKITENSIKIQNPGGIPGNINVRDLLANPRSILRNPKIANIFYIVGYIEKWGLGLKKIYEECIRNGNGEPNINSNTFFSIEIKTNVRMNSLEMQIFNFIKEKSEITRHDIELHFRIAESTARKYLGELKKKGLISEERIGRKVVYKPIE
ncbi:MAG: RNA-binding domain-containing protein [Candidatus Asgardarchaeia archaeon]